MTTDPVLDLSSEKLRRGEGYNKHFNLNSPIKE